MARARCRFGSCPSTLPGPNGHVYLVSAQRTPIGKFGGALPTTPAVELGGVAIRAAVDGRGPARWDADRRGPHGPGPPGGCRPGTGPPGRPARRPARDDQCHDDQPSLRLRVEGDHAGGRRDPRRGCRCRGRRRHGEHEPRAVSPADARFGYRLGDGVVKDATVLDGLWCSIEDCHMGTHAERVAAHDHVSRDDQDAFALESHRRAIAAIDAGRFEAEIAPVIVRDAKGRETSISIDEGPRRDTTAEALARLRPAFDLPEPEPGNRPRRPPSPPATPPGSPTGRPRPSSPASARSRSTTSSRWPGSSAMPRPRSSRSGCSWPRSPGSAGSSSGSTCRSRRSTSSRSTRRSRPRSWPTAASSGSTGRRSTSTAARSRSATRSGRAARGSWPRSSTSCSAARVATDSPRCASGAAAPWRWPSSACVR